MKSLSILILILIHVCASGDIKVRRTRSSLASDFSKEEIWRGAEPDQTVPLMSQPMVPPMPKSTETPAVSVTALHDGKWIAFRLKWKDTEPSEANRLATFSDAVAMEFPVKNNEVPPPIMMGGKDDPVHIFHWRYQYQLDAVNGKKSIEKIYPNMTTDMYPFEFKDMGNVKEVSEEQKEAFVGGTAAGNPQAFTKAGVDEIFAEGFGSSAVSANHQAKGFGQWKEGEWTVYVVRPLNYEYGSKLAPGKKSNVGFAVWQGGKKEVGAIKSLTMSWTPIIVEEKL